jgi:hypothetical protein
MDVSSPTLLLTATVDPRDCAFVARRDPRLRLRDYTDSLRRWLHQDHVGPIVWCENSGWPLDELFDLVDAERASARVRFVSFTAAPANGRGKGYGEMEIIERALAAIDAAPDTIVIKVTGRYYVNNIGAIVACLKAHGPDVATGPLVVPYVIASECFAATTAFMREYVCPRRPLIDDSRQHFFEHALALAVADGVARGRRHLVFPEALELDGISGGFGIPWRNTFFATAPVILPNGSIEVRSPAHLQSLSSFLYGYLALRRQVASVRGPAEADLLLLSDRVRRAADEPRPLALDRADVALLTRCADDCTAIATPSQFHQYTGLDPGFPGRLLDLVRFDGHPSKGEDYVQTVH